jgi:mannitol/fructose-specific phosphotransferase system IIA component (Ntr-type)
MHLGSLIRPELVWSDLPAGGRQGLLRDLAERIAAQGGVGDAGELFAKLWERESLGTTAVGAGIAIPHCKLPGLRRGVVAVGISRAGVDFGASDGEPVHVLFLVVSPADSPAEHLQVLAAISRWLKGGHRAAALRSLTSAGDVHRFLAEEAA